MQPSNQSDDLFAAMMEFRRVGLRHHAPGELGRTETALLMRLGCAAAGGTDPGVRASDLAKDLGVALPTLTQTVDSLVRAGLAERLADPSDRRVARVRATAAGAERASERREALRAWFAGLAGHLGDADSRELARLIRAAAAWQADHPFPARKSTPPAGAGSPGKEQ